MYGGDPIQAITIKRGAAERPLRGARRLEHAHSGAVTEVELVAPDDLAERPGAREGHSAQVRERHDRPTRSLLDRRPDVLLEVVQQGVHQLEHRELGNRLRG